MAEEVPEALTLLRAGLARISEEASAQEPSPDGYDDEEMERVSYNCSASHDARISFS